MSETDRVMRNEGMSAATPMLENFCGLCLDSKHWRQHLCCKQDFDFTSSSATWMIFFSDVVPFLNHFVRIGFGFGI